MGMAVSAEPCLLHVVPGRIRVHLPELTGLSDQEVRATESALRRLPGVRAVEANPLTANALILYDRQATNADVLLDAIRVMDLGVQGTSGTTEAATDGASTQPARTAAQRGPRVIASGRDGAQRVRIAVRGLDRDPDLARRVVERLQRRPGVRASASALTGRVLVEFDQHQEELRDILSVISDVELPDLPGEDNPTHPLDPAPLWQSATRTTGAAIGLGIITAQQVAGVGVSAPGAAQAAGIIGIVQGFPATRNGLRALLGRNLSDLLFGGATIVALALSGNPLGLTVSGLESLRLLTEIVARRRAFQRYEDRLGNVASAEPGTTIRLESGERSPLQAQVVEGAGVAIERDGTAVSIGPNALLSAGARVQGGPIRRRTAGRPGIYTPGASCSVSPDASRPLPAGAGPACAGLCAGHGCDYAVARTDLRGSLACQSACCPRRR